ncbi:hypothetical protein [Marinitoga lauensis]|uniref:hypothetical protein n=1 Tax=Marinitoga lauensis TaxID=2201189 RepID=UPI0010107407|nr:hypothetical protein [Marinitoga lauensis]
MLLAFFLTFSVGVFTGFFILALLTISARNELEDDILRLNYKYAEELERNEKLKKRLKELETKNAKLFTENMRLRRDKFEIRN